MVDWSRILKMHGGLVWQTVYRLLGHEADAWDCFQSTFLAVMAIAEKEAILDWPALLKRVATTRALNRLRQRVRDANRVEALDGVPALSRGESPEQAARGSELAEHLRLALAEIEPRMAVVFSLACLEDCSYREIAAELGITVNHVGVLLKRARAELQVHLSAFAPSHSGAKRDQ